MKRYYAYIRVSDKKQEGGASLTEQRREIERYATRSDLEIIRWFQDVETAAKTGRKNFVAMLRDLRKGKAEGVIFHKIDRSSRNRTEWAKLNDLFDDGVDVHFAHEGVDMSSRSGRVAADVQAALAIHYIANLRDETIKGMWGRLRQGLLPWTAPPGYRNEGGGKPKTIDPHHGPLVRTAFELFSTGRYSLRALAKEMERRGLRWHRGRHGSETKVTKNGIRAMLRNSFYIGVIQVKTTGETFEGVHESLISKSLFDKVQAVMDGRLNMKIRKHDFAYRKMLPCPTCDWKLTGERQKGRYVYYRCHHRPCSVCIPERNVDRGVRDALEPLRFSEDERHYLKGRLRALEKSKGGATAEKRRTARATLARIDERLMRLTDAFVDGDLEKDLFERRKKKLLLEKRDAEELLDAEKRGKQKERDTCALYLELATSALQSFEDGDLLEKRELLRELTSNWIIEEKNVFVELASPYREVAERSAVLDGDPKRSDTRNCQPGKQQRFGLLDEVAKIIYNA